jgi:hypothetical protein
MGSMPQRDPTVTEPAIESVLPEGRVETDIISSIDLPILIREVYFRLKDIGPHLPDPEMDREGALSSEAEEEVTQIYQRIDRALAVEEARADRLLRLYHL